MLNFYFFIAFIKKYGFLHHVFRMFFCSVLTIQDKFMSCFPCWFDIQQITKIWNSKRYCCGFLFFFLFFSLPFTYLLQYSKHTAKAKKKIPLLSQQTAKKQKTLRLHWKWLGIIPEKVKIYQDTAGVFQLLFTLPTWLNRCYRVTPGGCRHWLPSSAELCQVCPSIWTRLLLYNDSWRKPLKIFKDVAYEAHFQFASSL